MEFTAEQKRVIEARNCNLLVSAAAGSGKTATLAERVIGLITDKEKPADIDRLLVVTFTNAAAAQMRERIGEAIEKRLRQEGENGHLERQAALLHHARITTIDSFCLFLLRNHFHEIGLDPGFRVADPGELELIKKDVLKELMEDRLAQGEGRADFVRLLENLSPGGRESALEEMLLALHRFAQSFPWPEDWLRERFHDYCVGERLEDTRWGGLLQDYLKGEWEQIEELLTEGLYLCRESEGPGAYAPALDSDLEQVRRIARLSWEEQYEGLGRFTHERLSCKKQEGVAEEKKELVKALRERAKEDIKRLRKRFFAFSPARAREQWKEIGRMEKAFLETVLDFSERFAAAKREKNLVDFADMEHFALNILTVQERGEDGKIRWAPSPTAKDYSSYFEEILTDEYQDSNLVQEYLLQSVSGEWRGRYNRFMVGDLKQSIYRFRMARPEIFLEKYKSYGEEGEKRCIRLHKNFRSRKEVLDSVNELFYQLMRPEAGELSYGEQEALYPGAAYGEDDKKTYVTELLLLDGAEPEDGETGERRREARMVAEKIRRMEGSFPVTDEGSGLMRPARYKDMVVLLRNNAGWDEIFYEELTGAGVPAMLTARTGYFHAPEVQQMLNFLRVIDNPRQDIPLYGVMLSSLGGFAKEEAARLKALGGGCLYERLKASPEPKSVRFLQRIAHYRQLAPLTPLHQLLREYLAETGFLYEISALPGGEQRAANVKMLLNRAEAYEKTSCYGLFQFIRYLELLQKYEIEVGEAALSDEGGDVVRIMSVHKSKGLEFPVCFVCGLQRRFNRQDARQPYVADMDLGIGMEYRDASRRIRSRDLRKTVITRKQELEGLGEELRILYVAMTRAKEKLILTGAVKDYEKQILSYAPIKRRQERQLPLWALLHSNSLLDALLAALARPCRSVEVKLWDKREEEAGRIGRALKGQLTRLQLEEELAVFRAGQSGEEKASLQKAFQFAYAHEDLRGLYAKTTVSELKRKGLEESQEGEAFLYGEAGERAFEPEEAAYVPDFLAGARPVSGAARGTAYHRILELLDFARLERPIGLALKAGPASQAEASKRQGPSPVGAVLAGELEALCAKGLLDPAYPALIDSGKMERFLTSPLALRMMRADKKQLLYKESPFVLGLPASLLDKGFPEGEKVLIQGIIDVYFEEEGGLVLVDYKTDRAETAEGLAARYALQLGYYQRALEQLTGKPVKEKLLYSFALGRSVPAP